MNERAQRARAALGRVLQAARSQKPWSTLAGALVLLALHALLAHVLAGTSVVATLLAPSGAKAFFLLMLAVGFLLLRIGVLVVLPGWLAARAAMGVTGWLLARRQREASQPALNPVRR